ncbi:muscular LMNA-interacting protein isoform X2 [Pleurodeles waltl]|uniref:muscular LMNA-interacting protein isoform X2 n=1 Tax=Pleurodeles waltl TaxID=8319 RepID=UPI003709B2E2
MELGKPKAETTLNKASNHKMAEIVSTKELRHDFHGMAPGNFGRQTAVRVLRESSPLSIITTNKALSDEYQTNPLTFTFVPSVGRLPAHSQVAETSKSIFKVSKEKKQGRQQVYQSHIASKDWTSESGSCKDTVRDMNYPCKKDIHTQDKEAALDTFVDMQDNDIFQAEYVFVMDSDDEEDKSISRSINEKSDSMSKLYQPMPSAVSIITMESSRTTAPVGTSMVSAPQVPISPQEQHYKITSSYKTFAAIPTNTLLREQKAIDEPVQSPHDAEEDLDTHSKMCSPAQLRQQTEEVCAAIDVVLQDPLSLHHVPAPPSSKLLSHSDEKKMSSSLPRTAGRETKYAALSQPITIQTCVQQTQPGVIRPLRVKPTILLKREESYYINPYQ